MNSTNSTASDALKFMETQFRSSRNQSNMHREESA